MEQFFVDTTRRIRKLLELLGPNARVRVNLQGKNYISYSLQDVEKAFELFMSEGTALLIQENIYDDGKPMYGEAVRC